MNPDSVSAQVPDIADGVSGSTKASTTEVQTITSRKKTNAQRCREYRERKKLQNTMVQNITAERSDECSETNQLQAKKPKTNAERRKKHYEAQKLKKQESKKIPKTVKQKNKEYYDRKKKIQALNTLNHHSDAMKTAIENPTEASIEAEATAATCETSDITMIQTKEETETIGVEFPLAPPEDVECRACLQRFDYEAGLLDMFQAWEPPWNGMGESIAQDLALLANVNITTEDSYSKLICQFCHQKLLEACSFIVNVRINDRLLRQRAETLHEQDDTWPKPIQVDRNININVFNNAMDVEIKREVLSDDETYPSGAEDTFKGGADVADDTDNTFNEMEIKIEPEEIMQPAPFQIMVNETSTPENTQAAYALRRKNPRNTAKAYAIPSPTLDKQIKKKKNVTSDAVDAQESERNIISFHRYSRPLNNI